jgi:hypothetical protein
MPAMRVRSPAACCAAREYPLVRWIGDGNIDNLPGIIPSSGVSRKKTPVLTVSGKAIARYFRSGFASR